MSIDYANSVIDSYTGLPWCGRGAHLLQVGKNAVRRPSGKLLCLPCAAARQRERRARQRKERYGRKDHG